MNLASRAFFPALTLGILLASSGFAAQAVTINLNSEKQTIRGFGGMIHNAWQGYDLNTTDRALAFGNGPGQIGLTVLRIPVNSAENDWAKDLATAKDVVSRGGIVYASAWTQPDAISDPYTFTRWGATVNSFKVPAANYSAYADYLNKFTKYMKDNGAPLYAIGFQNEPDWADGWTSWTQDEAYNFIKDQGAKLRLNGTKVMTAESFAYNKTFYDKILNDASALANMDIIGAHFYGTNYSSKSDSTKIDYFRYVLADQKASTKERWMTEHYTDSKGNANLWRGYIITGDQDQTPKYDTVRALDVAYEIHRALVEGNFNQYTWWYIRRNYGLIMHTPGSDPNKDVKPVPTAAEVGKVTKRGYCVAQYAKYVRPGAIRVDATQNPDRYVYVSAYKKLDSVVVVIVNRAAQNSLSVSIPQGTGITSWKKITTSETKSIADDGTIAATNGAFTVPLDKESITTLIGILPSSGTSSSSSGTTSVSSSSTAQTQKPYSNSAVSIPGKIEAENYDLGGEGISYHDEDETNKGNVYRTDGIDIIGDATSGYKVGYTTGGEWLEYTINAKTAGIYNWKANVSAGGDGSSLSLQIDGGDQDTTVLPNTGNWDTYSTVSGTTTTLAAGNHTIRLTIVGAYFNIDWIDFTLSESPSRLSNANKGMALRGEYKVYNIAGQPLGIINLNNEPASKHIQKSGIYILKSVNGTESFKVQVNR